MKRKMSERERSINEIEVKQPSPDEARSLRERAMLVRVIAGGWTGCGRDQEIAEEVRQQHKAEGQVGVFTKQYIPPTLLRKVNKAVWAARFYHKAVTLPWGDSGQRLLSATMFFEYKKKMAVLERDFAQAVDEFVAGFAKAVLAQKPRLGTAWKASDYPSEDQVRGKFRFSVVVEPIPTSDDFRVNLSKEERDEIKREYDAEVRSRMKGAVKDVFGTVAEAVEELKGKLADPDKEIRSSSFSALRKLVASLPQLNSIVQDPQIAELGKRIAQELLTVNVDAVAHDSRERSKVHKNADAILAVLGPLQQQWTTQAVV